MCGISLIIGQKNSIKSNLDKMMGTIKHRGPDDTGNYYNENFGMGSCRLSIFDLSSRGKMPFADKNDRYLIVYNGEIYNFLELKKKFNIKTRTGTDTEVLIELYVLLGEECLEHLNGIFSFIIYDKIDKKIFCARDRLGVKPLFYYKKDNIFLICSEIKAILSIIKNIEINKDTIKTYLTTSFYDLGENTFFEQIKNLEAGHNLIFDLNNKNFEIKKYWKPQINKIEKTTEENLLKNLDKKILNSFTLQSKADTPIGLNVSSGIDSQIMITFLNRINGGQKNISANSYYFDEPEYDERKDLVEFASHYNWKINFFKIIPEDVINNFDNILNNQDEPFPGIVTIAKDLLIKRAYKSDCKVILEGQGGDDFAGGYKYIFPFYILDLLKKLNLKTVFSESYDFIKKENISLFGYLNFFFSILDSANNGGMSADGTTNFNKKIFSNSFLKNNDKNNYKEIYRELADIKPTLKKIIYRDLYYCKLPRILRSCDRASMSHGKELRVPLLDHEIVNFFHSLDSNMIIKNGNLRFLYRKYFDSFLNKDKKNSSFKKKKYVSDPQTKWLKKELFDWAMEIFQSKSFNEIGIYDQKSLIDYFNKFRKDENLKNSNCFWQAISISKFYENHTKYKEI